MGNFWSKVQKKTSITGSWLGLALSLVVIVYVFLTLDFGQVMDTFFHLQWEILLFAFGVYLLNYILRTLRFKILLRLDTTSFRQLFGLTSLYGMYLYLLPAKSGEASYPVMLKYRLGISLTYGAATLIVARFFDFATVTLFLPFVLAAFWNQIHPNIRWGALVFVILVAIGSVLGLWLVRRPKLWKTVLLPGTGLAAKIKSILNNLFTSLANIDRQGQYWQVAFITIAIWVCVQLNFYLIVLALGFPLTFFEIMVVSIIMVPMTLLPLQGFANLGTHEVGWAAAFALFGYTQITALAIAVSTHIILLAFVLALGAGGWLLLKS